MTTELSTTKLPFLITKVEMRDVTRDGLGDFIVCPIMFKVTEGLGEEDYVRSLCLDRPLDDYDPNVKVTEVKNKLVYLDPFFVSKIGHAYRDYVGKGICFMDVTRFPFITVHVNIKDPHTYISEIVDERSAEVILNTWDAKHNNVLLLVMLNGHIESVAIKLIDTTNPDVYTLAK